MRSYVFRKRPKYNCFYKNKKLKIINESYTSKIYDCINCKSIMDRDYNVDIFIFISLFSFINLVYSFSSITLYFVE